MSGPVMMMDLSDIRERLNAAVIQGSMPDYVRDVQHLLSLVYAYQREKADYDRRIEQASVAFARLKAGSNLTDTSESSKRDRELLWHGAREVARAFNLDPED